MKSFLKSFKNLEENQNINFQTKTLLKSLVLMKERATFVKDILFKENFF